MKVEFYCGAFVSPPSLIANDRDETPECGQEWVEEFDAQDGQHLARGETVYDAICPKCGNDAVAHVADDPESP